MRVNIYTSLKKKFHIPTLFIIAILITLSAGCFEDSNEVINPEYNIKINEVYLRNQSLIGEVLTNDSNTFLLIKLEITNGNSDYGLGLGASAFWISTLNETEIWWNSDIDGFVVVKSGETHSFSLDFLIPKDEKAEYLHCDLSTYRNDPRKYEIPLY